MKKYFLSLMALCIGSVSLAAELKHENCHFYSKNEMSPEYVEIFGNNGFFYKGVVTNPVQEDLYLVIDLQAIQSKDQGKYNYPLLDKIFDGSMTVTSYAGRFSERLAQESNHQFLVTKFRATLAERKFKKILRHLTCTIQEGLSTYPLHSNFGSEGKEVIGKGIYTFSKTTVMRNEIPSPLKENESKEFCKELGLVTMPMPNNGRILQSVTRSEDKLKTITGVTCVDPKLLFSYGSKEEVKTPEGKDVTKIYRPRITYGLEIPISQSASANGVCKGLGFNSAYRRDKWTLTTGLSSEELYYLQIGGSWTSPDGPTTKSMIGLVSDTGVLSYKSVEAVNLQEENAAFRPPYYSSDKYLLEILCE